MRELRFTTKLAKRTIIPVWLVEFFVRVDSMIQEGDERTVTPSDDFIQDDGVVGGLIEEGGNHYEFTVFPGPDNPTNRPHWEITISSDSIRQIAEKSLTHMDLWECSNAACQNLFSSPETVCMYCDYYDVERDARDALKAELSKRNFNNKEDWVRAYLSHFPDDHPLLIIGQYNSTGLGEELGWFSGADIQLVVEHFKSIDH